MDFETDNGPAYCMINSTYPTHFEQELCEVRPWRERIVGIRANASRKRHAELDESKTLAEGNPRELANPYRALLKLLPNLRVLGGCCSTDDHHVEAICTAVLSNEMRNQQSCIL